MSLFALEHDSRISAVLSLGIGCSPGDTGGIPVSGADDSNLSKYLDRSKRLIVKGACCTLAMIHQTTLCPSYYSSVPLILYVASANTPVVIFIDQQGLFSTLLKSHKFQSCRLRMIFDITRLS